jgi:hypothetical protein
MKSASISPLFGPAKDGLSGQHFPDNDAVIAAVKKWVSSAGADFYESSIAGENA